MKTMRISALLLVGLMGLAMAGEKEDLKARFEARMGDLLNYKAAGTIGETSTGYVEAVSGQAEKKAVDLIAAENSDRKVLYAILAKEENTNVETVAKNAAIVKFQRAGPEEFFKGKDGVWRKKKDMVK